MDKPLIYFSFFSSLTLKIRVSCLNLSLIANEYDQLALICLKQISIDTRRLNSFSRLHFHDHREFLKAEILNKNLQNLR